ncbi:hypothetical protein SLS56_000729 [Neofusicoccum ribis]|uniref:NAD(P)-binding protein n=1 Tax=Neofusicoccum ribis TaxID=45134 RepID=A0ABR3TC27_9PEZI
MDPSIPVDPSNIFSAKGLVIAVTGGGSGKQRPQLRRRPLLHQTSLITNTSVSGIGLAIATALHKTGATKVYLLGRRSATLHAAATALDPSLTAVIPVQCDITSLPSIRAAAQRIEADTGHLDVLINNAGRAGPPTKAASAATTVAELQAILLAGFASSDSADRDGEAHAFKETLFTNADDATRQRARVPAAEAAVDLDDQRTSQIVTVASIAAFNRCAVGGLAYGASKAAATHLGKMLATLLAPWGVRSNVIAPGGKLCRCAPISSAHIRRVESIVR